MLTASSLSHLPVIHEREHHANRLQDRATGLCGGGSSRLRSCFSWRLLCGIFHCAFRRATATPADFWIGSALLALIIGFTQFGFLSDGVHIAVVSFAMGVMNLALTRVGKQRVNLTFVTGTLRSLGEHLALAVMHGPLADSQGSWDTHSRRAGLLAWIGPDSWPAQFCRGTGRHTSGRGFFSCPS